MAIVTGTAANEFIHRLGDPQHPDRGIDRGDRSMRFFRRV